MVTVADLNANVINVTGPFSGVVPNETTENTSLNCEITHYKLKKYCIQSELHQMQDLILALPFKTSVKA